jgi:hypothetical protein
MELDLRGQFTFAFRARGCHLGEHCKGVAGCGRFMDED